jgi:hypothetical protein
MTWTADVLQALYIQHRDTYCLVEMFKGTVSLRDYVDLKQYIHLDNLYNCEKLCKTWRPFQEMPNLQQRNPHSGGPKRNLHGDFNKL